MFTCDCGLKTNSLKYVNGIRKCDACSSSTLSGRFERKMILETKIYAKDILQLKNKDGSLNSDFVDAYGQEHADKLLAQKPLRSL